MPKIQTVMGEIEASELGFTLPHEHLFLDLSYYWTGPSERITKRNYYQEPMTLEKRSEAIYNPWGFKDNTILDDMESTLDEVSAFMGYGGKSIVDVTAYGPMGRCPEDLRYVAGVTGANIVMSTGRYSMPSMDEAEKQKSIDEIEKMILNEFSEGAHGTGIKPGLIKLAFAGKLDQEPELRTLHAAARAQHKIGCAINIHPNIWEKESHQLLDLLEEDGAILDKVIFSHQDFTGEDPEYHDSLVKRGAYIEFDTFGCECVADPLDINVWFRSDGQKIDYVKKQIELGNVNKILLSGDMCLKLFFKKWGGWGYAHIPEHIIPRMRSAGISDEDIHTMTVVNPARVFGI